MASCAAVELTFGPCARSQSVVQARLPLSLRVPHARQVLSKVSDQDGQTLGALSRSKIHACASAARQFGVETPPFLGKTIRRREVAHGTEPAVGQRLVRLGAEGDALWLIRRPSSPCSCSGIEGTQVPDELLEDRLSPRPRRKCTSRPRADVQMWEYL